MDGRRTALAGLLTLCVFGCIGGGSPRNVTLTVSNESAYAGTVHRVSPGLLGLPLFPATGTANFTGCSSYLTAFGPGHNSVAINVNSDTLTLDLHGTGEASDEHYVLVDPSGVPTEVGVDATPTAGCGHL